MSTRLKTAQRGVSLVGAIVLMAIFGSYFYVFARCVPAFHDYQAIKMHVKESMREATLAGSTIQVRNIFNRRKHTDSIDVISGNDLIISKDSTSMTVNAVYGYRIHLGGIVSLMLDFDTTVKMDSNGNFTTN
jgi:Domain of unknown function (DUF4845)